MLTLRYRVAFFGVFVVCDDLVGDVDDKDDRRMVDVGLM